MGIKKHPNFLVRMFFYGGDKRAWTADLYTASVALSQLSYTPIGDEYGYIIRDFI